MTYAEWLSALRGGSLFVLGFLALMFICWLAEVMQADLNRRNRRRGANDPNDD
jgi:hypothetical protein